MPRNALKVILRYWIAALILSLPMGVPAVAAGVLSVQFLLSSTLLVAVGFNGLQWAAHRLLFGGTPEYEALRARGLDAWFDFSCPPPLRPENNLQFFDDDEPEPEIRWACNNCGAEPDDLDAPCRVCGYEQYECPRCGAPVKDEFAACRQCGNDPLGE